MYFKKTLKANLFFFPFYSLLYVSSYVKRQKKANIVFKVVVWLNVQIWFNRLSKAEQAIRRPNRMFLQWTNQSTSDMRGKTHLSFWAYILSTFWAFILSPYLIFDKWNSVIDLRAVSAPALYCQLNVFHF